MTVSELILIDKSKVRRDSNLMSLYLQYFKEAFNTTPSCAGCSFSSDWLKLVTFYSKKQEKKVTLQKENTMNTISIKRIQGKILSYKKDGRTFRQYDNILTDSFINEYLSNGTESEIEERKKLFNFPVEESPVNTTTFVSQVAEENKNVEPVKEIKRRKKRTPKNG